MEDSVVNPLTSEPVCEALTFQLGPHSTGLGGGGLDSSGANHPKGCTQCAHSAIGPICIRLGITL